MKFCINKDISLCVWRGTIETPPEKRKVLSANSHYQYMPPMNQINREMFIWDYEGTKLLPRRKG